MQATYTYSSDAMAFSGAGVFAVLPIILIVLSGLVHLACAIAVGDDCGKYRKKMGDTVFLTTFIWVLIALLTGPVGVGIYWVMHRSTINPANRFPESQLPAETVATEEA